MCQSQPGFKVRPHLPTREPRLRDRQKLRPPRSVKRSFSFRLTVTHKFTSVPSVPRRSKEPPGAPCGEMQGGMKVGLQFGWKITQ